MSDGGKTQVTSILDALDQEARDTAVELNKASGENAVWDKALKALKPGLADLNKVCQDAEKEAKLADDFIKELEKKYDSSVSRSVRTVRGSVEKEIEPLKGDIVTKEQSIQPAKDVAADAQKELDKSTAKFDISQKNLQGLSKQIQEGQKALVALETEVKDAHGKNQLVEAVVKLEDLRDMLREFNKLISSAKDTDELWKNFHTDAQDLIQKTKAQLDAQANVSNAEAAYNKAKVDYEEAQKGRLDNIKKQAADKDKTNDEISQKSSKGK